MMKKDIYKAYDTITLDAESKERMLGHILKTASMMEKEETGTERKETNMRKWNTKHKLQAAAALALVLTIPVATAYATDFFGFRGVGRYTVEDPMAEVTEREAEFISMQGMADSPETKACVEWNDFYWEYDKDGAIISQIGDGPTGVDPKYEAYTCYTQEMTDKVDEIAAKYGLSLLTGMTVANTYEELCSAAGVGNICGNTSAEVELAPTGGCYYDDGSFDFDGTATVTGGENTRVIDYQFRCQMKGTFCPYTLNIENASSYEQWEYTTASGQKVLLAKSDFKALIIVDTEQYCIVVNVLSDTLADTFDVEREMLEKVADAFDFSAV